MKKVLSVAMASAMVLGMGANAFAIQYSTGSNETASWPKGFQFDGSLFVTDKNGNIVEDTLTDLNGKTSVDFQEGDTIWMPLYANNQRVYNVIGGGSGLDEVDSRTEYLSVNVAGENSNGVVDVDSNSKIQDFTYMDENNKVIYYYGTGVNGKQYADSYVKDNAGWRSAQIKSPVLVEYVNGSYKTTNSAYGEVTVPDKDVYETKSTTVPALTLTKVNNPTGEWGQNSSPAVKVTNGSKSINTVAKVADTATNADITVTLSIDDLKNLGVELPEKVHAYDEYTDPVEVKATSHTLATAEATTDGSETVELKIYNAEKKEETVKSNLYVKVTLPKVDSTKDQTGTIIGGNTDETDTDAVYVEYGHYTGNIDKNWSINLIEEDNGVADLIEKAELYKATAADYTSYSKYTEEIQPNAVYLKVTLKDNWKLADDANLKYYVYVADNKSNTNVTNKVWVSGKYAASYRYVDFTWTNDASKAGLWKVKDGENGVAVFDFADKAFFQVKMYSKESMYLDLSTAYDKAIAGDFSEADAFFSFDNENANFSRTGTLILVSDDASLIPYQVTENGYTKVDAQYVEDFAIAHTNEKVNGFVFETKELGNYVLATEEVAEEEDNNTSDNTQEVVVPDTDNNETNNNSKPNPSTGAEDFVGLAVSLAVVSVAAAGALALKK